MMKRRGKGKRGRGGRERGAVVLTALEQEMLDWALDGFQPVGPEGLQPTPGCDDVLGVCNVSMM